MLIPNQILEEFSKIYNLPEIRSFFEVIFNHASNSNEISAELLYSLQKQLIILIEAVWLLNTYANKTQSDRIKTIVYIY
jgi:hypothetical protein